MRQKFRFISTLTPVNVEKGGNANMYLRIYINCIYDVNCQLTVLPEPV
jgi:hypothetical protein